MKCLGFIFQQLQFQFSFRILIIKLVKVFLPQQNWMLLEILCIYTARWSFQELYHILNHYKICRSKLEFIGVLLNRIWDQSVLKFLLPCFALHRKMFRQGDDSLLKDLKTGIVEHPSKPFKLKQWKKSEKFIELRRTLCLNVICLVPELCLCNSKENLLCVLTLCFL